MERQRADECSVQHIVFQDDLFDRIAGIVPDAVTFAEKGRNIDRIVPHEPLTINRAQEGDPVESERFQFAVRIVTYQVPALLRLFQKMRIEAFVNDPTAVPDQRVVELYGIPFADGLEQNENIRQNNAPTVFGQDILLNGAVRVDRVQ